MPQFAPYLSAEKQDELKKIANAIVAPGHGILASDESNPSMTKKLQPLGLENIEENRRAYREVLYTASPDLGKWLGGCIMFDETYRQSCVDGTPFVKALTDRGVMPGIKVDKGLIKIAGTFDEQTTQGLDDLSKRCEEYKKGGCQFAKWRCALTIGPLTPSVCAMKETSQVLARYASICQQNGLVPIVEPEILADGDHPIEICEQVTEVVLSYVYRALNEHNIFLEGSLLKPNMVTPGFKCATKATPADVAKNTVDALMRTVPAAVPGVVFLSGGWSEEEATVYLNAVNQYAHKQRSHPWALSFSYGRALQASVLSTWHGKQENVKAAQDILVTRCKANSEACQGKYAGSAAGGTAGASLYEANRNY